MRSTTLLLLGAAALPAAFGQLDSAAWTSAYTKAASAVAQLSTAEKVDLATGRGFLISNSTGSTPSVPKIGFPGLILQDGPIGVRSVKNNSAFPAGITIAATFNRTLMRQRGVAIGEEYRGKGIHVHLGPMTNMMRAPAAGRNWEGFGGDPYLAGEATYETIIGVQSQGVQATVKHFIDNEQEHQRMDSSSNVDDRTQHEIYLHPFLRAVQAEVASVMCSYNQINGTYACSNSAMLGGNSSILKGELGFRGYVVSDWFATHATTDATAGLDMNMPGGLLSPNFGLLLQAAVGLGIVAEARVTDMATRILAGWYLLGQDTGYPALNLNANVQGNHASIIRTVGAAGTVLLKNTGGVLPLSAPKSVAIIGSDAGPNPDGLNSCGDLATCDKGTLGMGWGSGSAAYPYLVTPLDAITARVKAGGGTVKSSLSDTDLNAATTAASGADYAFVFINADSGEGGSTVEGNNGDRNDLNAWHSGDALVQKVASVNKNTIVVAHTVGPIVVEAWINNPNVTGVLFAHLPGQESGNAIVDVLWGTVNPSGRLPYTVGKSIDDYAAKVNYATIGTIQIPYTEGLFIDYRHFDQAGIVPRFEFGFGLSYTTFAYSGLSISGSVGSYTPPTGQGSSLASSLHTKVFTFKFTLKNNGTRAGNEVPQLYLTPPASANSPPYILKGFDNVYLASGASTTVSFQVSRYDLSVWNVATQRWTIASGQWGATIGASSRDRRLTGTFTV